jgi:hypothetical protein
MLSLLDMLPLRTRVDGVAAHAVLQVQRGGHYEEDQHQGVAAQVALVKAKAWKREIRRSHFSS